MRPRTRGAASLSVLHYIIGHERQWPGLADFARAEGVSADCGPSPSPQSAAKGRPFRIPGAETRIQLNQMLRWRMGWEKSPIQKNKAISIS
jgi:hypothetical protein